MASRIRTKGVITELERMGLQVEINDHSFKVYNKGEHGNRTGPMIGQVGCHGKNSQVLARHVSTMCEAAGISYEVLSAASGHTLI